GTTSPLWWPTRWRTRPLTSGRSAHAPPTSTPNSDLDHDFDVARLLRERLLETFQRYPPGDEPAEPVGVGGGQRGDRVLVVPPVGADGAEHDLVAQHDVPVDLAHVQRGLLTR